MTAEEFRAFCRSKRKGVRPAEPSRDPGDETEQSAESYADRLQRAINQRTSSHHQTPEPR